jgi:tellurite resistance protein
MKSTLKLNPPQALVYAMITTAAVDRSISDEELTRIGSIVRELPAFSGFTGDWLLNEAQAAGKLLATPPNGIDTVLDLVHDALPAELYETAYVLCAEVAMSDLEWGPEEARFLEKLATKLGLDNLVTAALDRAAEARHQKA